VTPTRNGPKGSRVSSLNFLNFRSREFCVFVHARPDSTDGAIWRSNGPIYVTAGFHTAVSLLTATYATAYTFCKICSARSQYAGDVEVHIRGAKGA
jgi:hypothetical protein